MDANKLGILDHVFPVLVSQAATLKQSNRENNKAYLAPDMLHAWNVMSEDATINNYEKYFVFDFDYRFTI